MKDSKQFESWENIIIDFLLLKTNAAEEIYLKDRMKEMAKYFKSEESKDFFTLNKNKNQFSIEFQRERFREVSQLEENPASFTHEEWWSQYESKCIDLKKKYSANHWIDEASKNASSVSFATHVTKLTHSKIDTPSFFDSTANIKATLITTSSLKEKTVDGAVAGNQFAPIFQFLELEFNGKKLAEEFSDLSNQILLPFSTDGEQLRKWNVGFKKALSSGILSSHFLIKQIYFPVHEFIRQSKKNADNNYHLLCNVNSSSLAQKLYENIFSEKLLETKGVKEKEKYTNELTTYFVNKAALGVTASNHSNASQLNGKRGGKLYLLTSQPPNMAKPI